MMDAEQGLIVCRNLSKIYEMGTHIVHALHDVAFQVDAGEFMGVMGASGSGKSTLLHILGCLDRPSEGAYFLHGADVSAMTDRQLSLVRATQIGFVFQSFNLIPQCNVFQNVALPFLYRKGGAMDTRTKRRVQEAVERVGLAERMNHKPAELSGGEMQRVAIARALVGEPLAILADEPTGNLDSETSAVIMNLFTDLNRQGVTIMVVTHDASVAAHCRRIIRLKDGRVEREEGGA